ncbi:MAG: diguanylate cyclase [Gammaproteobacteria bacterium]|nr:diguanylate cyclase [Gammaproteobacteria bacterium]MDH5511902.1 diguanylate cyclase [Gammaproteobacteria bacterium]
MAQSLTRIYLQVILILILFFLAIGYVSYLAVRDMQLSLHHDKVLQIPVDTADRIVELLSGQRLALGSIAKQSGVAAIMQHGTAAERARKESEIKSQLPGALSVYLLPWNDAGPVTSAGTADPVRVDYVRRVAATSRPATPEFQATGTAGEYYNLAVPVRDEQQNVTGYLLAEFPRAPIQSILEQSLPPNEFMELRQPATSEIPETVLTAGNTTNSGSVSITHEIAGSSWILNYQSVETPTPLLSGIRKIYFTIAAVLFTAVLLLLFRLYRRTVRSVRHDIQSLIRMFQDLREGSVRVSYPMALKDFTDIFAYLRDRGQRLVKEKEKLKDMGLMDHLSQLGNRRHFEARLKELFDSAKSNGPSSVLIIDVDHFKAVNDKHGHDAGDALIVGFANALRKVVRQTDVLARLGGDEFCIIYSYAPLRKATELVDRLRRQLPREIPLTKGVMHSLRWTGGLSAMHDKDTKPDDVLWRADQALLRAKESGRNNTKIYDPATGAPVKKSIMAS